MERVPEALRTSDRMEPPDDLTRTLQQVLARHQRQVIRRSLIASSLILGCLVLGWWRLSVAGVATAWGMALGAAGLTGLILWQGFLIRRDWLSASALTMQLDRALGLQARLVTAAEFADAAEPPPLYHVLVQETQQALSGVSSRLPRATGRSTWVLAAVLLLLWLWPHRGAALQQLAMRPPAPPAHIPPVPPPPEPPQNQQQQQQQNQQNRQDQQSSQGQQQQPSSSQSGSGQQDASHQQPQGGSSSPSSKESGKNGSQPQPPQGSSGSHASDQAKGQGNQPQSQAAAGSGQSSSKTDAGSQQQQASSGKPGQDKSSSGGQQQSAAGASQRAKQGAGGDQQKAGAAGSKDAKGGAGSSSAKAGTSPGDAAAQAALKGDIQQLLKELSGELQTLQAQGTQTPSDQPHALPGTTTDPKLYDDTAEPLASNAGGRPLAIALDVDAQSTSKTRPGGGTAPPSGEVSDAPPQQSEEAVALAEPSTDASAVHRQAIPPEYQPVFERLSQRHDTSSKP